MCIAVYVHYIYCICTVTNLMYSATRGTYLLLWLGAFFNQMWGGPVKAHHARQYNVDENSSKLCAVKNGGLGKLRRENRAIMHVAWPSTWTSERSEYNKISVKTRRKRKKGKKKEVIAISNTLHYYYIKLKAAAQSYSSRSFQFRLERETETENWKLILI